MVDTVAYLLPIFALASHIIFVVLFTCFMFRELWGRPVVKFMGEHSLILGLLVSLSAIIGSLFYSEIMGFEACSLCWWQRVFLYPTVFIFATAAWYKERLFYRYVVPPIILASIIAIYQSYVYLGGSSLLTCTSAEGACAKIYVMAFGYITIPVMSLTVSLYILLFAWADKIYRNETK